MNEQGEKKVVALPTSSHKKTDLGFLRMRKGHSGKSKVLSVLGEYQVDVYLIPSLEDFGCTEGNFKPVERKDIEKRK